MIAGMLIGLAAMAPAGDCTADGEAQVCFVNETTDPIGVLRVERTDGSDWIVVEPDIFGFGAESGDRLDVRFPGSDGLEEGKFQSDCDDWGGQLAWRETFEPMGEFVCEDVDF